MTRRALIPLLAALVATPLAYAGWNGLQLHRGTHVLLRVRPADPYDPFRGEYVALSYRESTLAHGRSGRVYVPLRRRPDGIWAGTRATSARPSTGVYLRGTADRWRTRFGIERFYVREGTSRRYEDGLTQRRLYADVVVQRSGQARLAGLVIRR